MPLTPNLLFADDWLVVFDKPSGLLSVPGKGPAGEDHLLARVQSEWPDLFSVHRLDQATSGIIVFARDAVTQRQLSELFAARQVEKQYVAVVAGHVQEDEGLIDLPLLVDWPNRPMQKVNHESGKPSQTAWRVLARSCELPTGQHVLPSVESLLADNHCIVSTASSDYSLPVTALELRPLTGRSHQLRVHLQAIGHAISAIGFMLPVKSARPRRVIAPRTELGFRASPDKRANNAFSSSEVFFDEAK